MFKDDRSDIEFSLDEEDLEFLGKNFYIAIIINGISGINGYFLIGFCFVDD